MKRTLLVLTALFAALCIYSNLYWIILFDSNYLPQNSYMIDCLYPALPADSLKDISFLAIIDSDLNARIMYGSNIWDIDNNLIMLGADEGFIVHSDYTFAEITGSDYAEVFDSVQLFGMIQTGMSVPLLFVNDLHTEKYLYSTYYSIAEDINAIDQYNILKTIMEYRLNTKNENYAEALSLISPIHKDFPDDENIFRMYIVSLLNIGDFYNTNREIEQFYSKTEFDEFYYSIKTNLFALSGNLESARNILEEGRTLFPESDILIRDAYNLYSVVDTVQMKMIREILKRDSIFLE